MNVLVVHIGKYIRSSLSGLLAWLLLLRVVFPCMDSADEARLYALVQHFQEHRVTEEHLDWWTFLTEHYSPSSTHHSSKDHSKQHHRLPLHCSVCGVPSFAAIPSIHFIGNITPKPLSFLPPCDFPSHSSILYVSIFQPPKLSL